MTVLISVLLAVILLLITGAAYYAFIHRPRYWKRLNADIDQSMDKKYRLLKEIDNAVANKQMLEKEMQQINEQFDKMKRETKALKASWVDLNSSISKGRQQLNEIERNKDQYESELKNIKAEIEELKSTTQEISLIREKKRNLAKDLKKIQGQFDEMRSKADELQERKSDLESENSHLSLEIAKKKTSYESRLVRYDDVVGDKRSVKHIGYTPNSNFSNDCYPYVSMPKPNSVIKFPRRGRVGIRGYKEPAFEEEIKTYFHRQRRLQFFNDRFVMVSNKTRPYEPDFTLIDEKNDLNLFIDIEIDEPYDSKGRFATHFKGQDDFRNKYFNDRGWVVIRFSEKQVHQNPKGCCRLIADVIKSLDSKFTIPIELQSSRPVPNESFWSKVEAEKWEKEKYREKYLGIGSFVGHDTILLDTENLLQNETETEAEALVDPLRIELYKPKGKINEINRHHRDSRIKFFPEPHIYLIDDNPRTISASTIVKQFFMDFDEDYWASYKANRMGVPVFELKEQWQTNRMEAANLGTQLHSDIERFFETDGNERPWGKKEFDHFLDFNNSHLTSKKLYRTEWRIFDDLHYVAGTADMVFKKPDNTYVIYDWKRSKEIKTSNNFSQGIGPCSDLDDCNFNHYCLQLNIYKKILEDFYAKPVSEMYFVQLHPNFETFKMYSVPDWSERVSEMLTHLRN